MGTYTNIFIRHNFDTSSFKNLAKSVSEKLEVNVVYGFPVIYEEFLELFDEEYTIKDGFIILGTIVHHKNALLYNVECFEYLESHLFKKYGYELAKKNPFIKVYENHAFSMVEYIKKSTPYYTVELSEDADNPAETRPQKHITHFSIGKECISTQDFIHTKWWDFCESLTQNESYFFNYFDEIRPALQSINSKLTNDKIYFTADSGHGLDIDEDQNTWQEIEAKVNETAEHRIFDISKIANRELEYLPIVFKNKHNVYPLLVVDDFKHNYKADFVIKDKLTYKEWQKLHGSNLLVDLSNLLNMSLDVQKMLSIANKIEEDLPLVAFKENVRLKANFLIARVSIIANDFEKATKFQCDFLNNTNWCKSNFGEVQDYLAIVFSRNNPLFIQKTLLNYAIIQTEFYAIYHAYLKETKASFYNKEIDIIHANYRLQTMKQLYGNMPQDTSNSETALRDYLGSLGANFENE